MVDCRRLTDEQIDRLLAAVAPPAEAAPPSPQQIEPSPPQIELAHRRVATGLARYRRRFRYRVVAGVLAAALLVALLWPYVPWPVERPPDPPAPPVAARPGTIPPDAPTEAGMWLRRVISLRQQERLAEYFDADFAGRDLAVQTRDAVYRQEAAWAARVPTQALPLRAKYDHFNDAVLAAVMLAAAEGAEGVSVLPVNAQSYATAASAQPASAVTSYYLAREATHRLSDLLQVPYREFLASELAVKADAGGISRSQPQPSPVMPGLSSEHGRAPRLFAVSVHLNPAPSKGGQLRLVARDPLARKKPVETNIGFANYIEPTPFFAAFTRSDYSINTEKIWRTGAHDEMAVQLAGGRREARTHFVAPGGLDIAKHFSSRLVEIYFEARAEVLGTASVPTIQFGAGGCQVLSTGGIPSPLGADWRLFSLPVDLADADRWTSGLFVQALSLPAGTKVVVHIRNAWIRCVISPCAGSQYL